MAYIEGVDRRSSLLLPDCIEDYVGSQSLVRVIDAFVASLDMEALQFGRSTPAETGRPGYDPRDLLRLYVYGYLNGLRSSRRLSHACRSHLELLWLMRKLAPDFKTIAEFRRINGAAIAAASAAFVRFCRKEGLCNGAIAAIDCSKIRAVASRKQVMSTEEIAEAVARLDRSIADYMQAMDVADEAEAADPGEPPIAPALEALKSRRAALVDLAADLAAEDRRLGVLGEPDARPMGSGKGGKPPSYNVQIAVDPDSHMIVHHAVTTEATDNRLLYPMARATKAVLGVETLQVVADAGYANAGHAAQCEAADIEPVAPAPKVTNTRGAFYTADQFFYDAASDSFVCPAGRRLHRNGTAERDEAIRYRAKDCSGCPLKSECTKAKRRYVYRLVHHEALERMTRRAAEDPSWMILRRSTAEHPFACLKRCLGGRFLLRDRYGAATETALAVLCYNLKRAAARLGARTLREALA